MRWREDSRELFYVDAQQMLSAVVLEPGPPFRTSTPEPLFDMRPYARPFYDVTADGQRFLLLRDGPAGTASRMTELVVIQSWTQELLERAPKP